MSTVFLKKCGGTELNKKREKQIEYDNRHRSIIKSDYIRQFDFIAKKIYCQQKSSSGKEDAEGWRNKGFNNEKTSSDAN